MSILTRTDIPGYICRRGKVRDIYDLRDGRLVVVQTDRISAFDVILGSAIPDKGRVLTGISVFWFKDLFGVDAIPNHLIGTELEDLPKAFQEPKLEGRVMICEKLEILPVEWVVRGYLAGSGWKEYQKTNRICGIKLPDGLEEFEKLRNPIFTPATKAQAGHDENISFERACEIVGKETTLKLMGWSFHLYEKARLYALEKGIIIADTKFEFGMKGSQPFLADEVLTPDSSRFWPEQSYDAGKPVSMDKQFVRDYLEDLCRQNKWDKTSPGPKLPDWVIAETRKRYIDIYEQLTGKRF